MKFSVVSTAIACAALSFVDVADVAATTNTVFPSPQEAFEVAEKTDLLTGVTLTSATELLVLSPSGAGDNKSKEDSVVAADAPKHERRGTRRGGLGLGLGLGGGLGSGGYCPYRFGWSPWLGVPTGLLEHVRRRSLGWWLPSRNSIWRTRLLSGGHEIGGADGGSLWIGDWLVVGPQVHLHLILSVLSHFT